MTKDPQSHEHNFRALPLILLGLLFIILGAIAGLASFAVLLPARSHFYETFAHIHPGDSERRLIERLKTNFFKCSQGEDTYYITSPIESTTPIIYEVKYGEVKAISFSKDNDAYKIMFGSKDRGSEFEVRYGRPTQKLTVSDISYAYYHKLRLYADKTPFVVMSVGDAVVGVRLISRNARLYPQIEPQKHCLKDYYKNRQIF